MLQLNNITKIYATDDFKQTALNNVSLSFRKNEFVSILGPSGSGKTTLLNIIGGLDNYTDGDLIINEVSTKSYNDRDWDLYRNHSIGFVFQSYNLISHQSILSNVELALTLSGVDKKNRRKKAIEALKKVGLEDHINKRPNQLSGGQMQRVAIARALVNDPDILLADEPTGALDSSTSTQIMDLLSEVANDRLVIMVTHNAELAEKYSTRIIELKDGEIIGDTNSFEAKNSKNDNKKVKKRKNKKTNMSFKTALSLSLNNLLTKKGRTILTSFAGSIGIIGIALILSLSHGINSYINKTEKETLSSYPLLIQKESVDMSTIIKSMTEDKETSNVESDEIASINIMEDMITAFSKDVKKNNVKDFKNYLEKNSKKIKGYTSSIQYGYNIIPNLYKLEEDKVVQVNPTSVLDAVGMGTSNVSSAYSSYMSNYNVFTELIDNDDLLKQQYNLVKGKWPKNYNELVLIVGEDNQVSDYTLYSLGLLDQDVLKEQFSNIISNKKVKFEEKKIKMDDIIGLNYKLLLNTDYFEKVDNIWIDKSSDEEYIKRKVSEAEDIKIVGIIKPNPEAVSGMNQAGIVGYKTDLMKHLVEKIGNTEIAKIQLENKEINVFTGTKFQDTKKFDMDKLSNEQLKSIQNINEADLAEFIKTYSENALATYEENLNKLGIHEIDNPDSISIYPKDFESKEKITEIISDYNKNKKDEDKIEYSDIVGIIMSSVSSIVNVISSVLIAFVAISLVVSSIMIAIITYISVIERTKEIGILRAIGASKKDISRVFNAETLIEGLAAGLFGIVVTLLLNVPINLVIKKIVGISNISKLPIGGAIILIIISIVLTVIAGFIPAKIASKKDPVVALRSE